MLYRIYEYCVGRIVVIYKELLGPYSCNFRVNYAGRIAVTLSYWGQISVVILIMYAGLLLPIELVVPDFFVIWGHIPVALELIMQAGLLLPIELLGL